MSSARWSTLGTGSSRRRTRTTARTRGYASRARGTALTVLGNGSVCVNDWTGTPIESDAAWAFQSGLTGGCRVDLLCPNDPVTRAELATWLARAFTLPATANDYFTDDETSPREADINRTAEAGITTGCGPTTYCPAAVASRGELATYLARALNLPPTSADYFTDDTGSVHEADINALAEAGIASGCGSGLSRRRFARAKLRCRASTGAVR